MSKSKKEQEVDPFEGFNSLKGNFQKPLSETEEIEDDITSGDRTIIKDSAEDTDTESIEAKSMAAGDKALAELEKKKEELAKKKQDEVIVEEGSTQEIEETKENEATTESVLKVFTKNLYDEKVIDFDDTDEDFEDSEEGVKKLVDKTIQNRIDNYFESLNPEYIKFLEFVQNGGRPKDFLDVYYGTHTWEGFSAETEDSQKLVVTEALRLAEHTDEEINEMIEEWSENGTLGKKAKIYLPKLQKNEVTQKQEILVQAENEKKAKEAYNKKYWEDFKTDLFKKEEVMGFKLTPKLKEKVWNSLTTIDPRTGKTDYQKAVEGNRDAAILFALQAATGFDKTKLETQVKTKVSNQFHELLENHSKTTKQKISSGRTNEDYNNNPFEKFKNFK